MSALSRAARSRILPGGTTAPDLFAVLEQAEAAPIRIAASDGLGRQVFEAQRAGLVSCRPVSARSYRLSLTPAGQARLDAERAARDARLRRSARP